MGRDQVLSKAWRRPEFRSLRRSAQALFAQLVTQETPTMAGVVPLMPAKWASVCAELDEASVMADLAALSGARRVVVDTATFEVLIRDYMSDSGATRHRHHFTACLKAAVAVESPVLRAAIAVELQAIGSDEALDVAELLVPHTDRDPTEVESGSDSDAGEVRDGSEVSEA